ncbi:hypothetical protein [Micromonospora zamorensis]|uniref:hypothetical protein n=1 Tax=Micromonospora zamorensis TaxID=709883 RepID=UPI0033BDC6A2
MSRPAIALVGNVNPARASELSLIDPEAAESACREIGRALAEAGCDLIMFSARHGYAEPAIAEGYAQACRPNAPGRIVLRSLRHRASEFTVPDNGAVILDVEPDSSDMWEISFYRSILNADGVVLIGGGRTTKIAGIIGVASGIPIAPVAAFGGEAAHVWGELDKSRNDVLQDELAKFGGPWRSNSAQNVAASLLGQMLRREERHRSEFLQSSAFARNTGVGLAVATVALLAALASIILIGDAGKPDTRMMALLLMGPMLAAIAGAIVRDSLQSDHGWLKAAVHGFSAGTVTVLLYVAAQLLAMPEQLNQLDARRLLFFVVPLGFSTGFTFDLLFDRLRSEQGLPQASPEK